MRLNVRRRVDLPQPEGPMSAVIFSGAMLTLTLVNAWKSP